MSSFPEDVFLEIFVRLPRKSIYLCKCVCKSWFHIISCPSFVKIHLNHAKRKNNLILMFTQWVDRIQGCGISTIGYDSVSSSKELHECDDAVKRDYPLENKYHIPLLHGHSNGLIYFQGTSWGDKRRFFLWNPSTKEYKILPKSPNKYVSFGVMHGFGYDYKIDAYKVIHIGKPNKHENRYFVDIYTLGSNSWNSSYTDLDISNEIRFTNGVLSNGALHWLCIKRGKVSKLIISFNISDEKFKEIEPPKEVPKECLISVGTLEGLLCLFVKFGEVQFIVWVMQDYGVQESWTKRYVITHERSMKYPSNVFLLCSLDKGKILFSDGDTLVLYLYDPKHEYAREISIEPEVGSWIWNSVNYFESLVSVNSGRYVGGNQEDSSDLDSDSEEDLDSD